MITIAPGVLCLTRADWGADPNIVGGHLMDGAAEKIEIPVHHTVIVDNDATPDLWETLAEVKAKMRQLQVIRADITDVPYNAVGFLMANGDLIVCEGRGPNRSGAHTIGHNRVGYGFAFEGNMEAMPNPDVSLWVSQLNRFFGWLKAEQLPRLGQFVADHEHGPHQFFPHQQVSATACPGRAVIPVIDQFRYELAEEDDEMKLPPFIVEERRDAEDRLQRVDGVWVVYGDLSGRYQVTDWGRVDQYRFVIQGLGGKQVQPNRGEIAHPAAGFLAPIPLAGAPVVLQITAS